MANDPLFIIAALACLAVVVILLIGIGGFAKGGEFNRKNANKLMRWRIGAQAVAVVLILIYVALILIGKANIRFLLIPVLGLIATLAIITTTHLLLFDSFDWISELSWLISFDFSAYNSINLLIVVSVILGLIIWLITFRLIHYKRIMRKQRPVYLLVKVFLVLSLLVSAASNYRNGSELIFLFAPFSMALADYIENRDRTLVKEVILWFFVLFPGLLILIQM